MLISLAARNKTLSNLISRSTTHYIINIAIMGMFLFYFFKSRYIIYIQYTYDDNNEILSNFAESNLFIMI